MLDRSDGTLRGKGTDASPVPAELRFAAHTGTGRIVVAHRLVAVRRPEDADTAGVPRDLVAVLTALEGHRDASFTVQWVCDPRPGDARGGRIELAVLTALPLATDRDRQVELVDDVSDLLNGLPHLWRFEPVTDHDELARLIDPLEAEHVAEIVRREEELPHAEVPGLLGFSDGDATRDGSAQLWSLWTLGPPVPDTDRLAAGLLAQEAPVCLRMTLEPTSLSEQERDLLEEFVHATAPLGQESHSYRAAHHTLESLLFLRPLFEARCMLASPDPLSPSLVGTVGHTLSEPSRHVAPPPPALSGGYSVRRPATGAPWGFASLTGEAKLESLAPAGLARLRRLFGVWEAATLFRLPVLGEAGTHGLPVDDGPVLPGVLSHLQTEGTRVGQLPSSRGRQVAIGLDDRFRHTYVVGQTGTGKSTLLMNMALDDITAGHGVCVIDPHGDLVEGLLSRIPEHRLDDVVLIDPGDPEAVVGVNLLEAESDLQQNYLVSELSNMFYALFDPGHTGIVGPRFESMLRQAVLLLQAGDVGASFLDVSTVFSDPAVREHLSAQIKDPLVAEYWRGEIVQNRSNDWGEVVSWFRSKFEVFRTSSLLRRVVGQATSTVSFGQALRERGILLVNLSKGALGEYNSALLGHVIVMKLWGAVLERALTPAAARNPFFVYIDEFQSFTTQSLDTMLAEARKYGVGLTLANQFFEQLETRTRAALLGNVGSKLAFRLGPSDATAFTRWIGEEVEADELTHLPNHRLIAALSPDGMPTAPVLLQTQPPGEPHPDLAALVRKTSRARHAVPIARVDEDFAHRWAGIEGSIASQVYAEVTGTAQSPNKQLAWPSQPAQPQRTSTTSFLDDWLARRKTMHPRRWGWIDEWIDARLQERGDATPSVVRGTIDAEPDGVDWEALGARLNTDPDDLRTAVESSGFLTLPRHLAGRFVLEMRARRLGGEIFLPGALASARVPDATPLVVIDLPTDVLLRLGARDISTVGGLRAIDAETLNSLDLPEPLLAELRALRGEVEPSRWLAFLETGEPPGPEELLTRLSPNDRTSLREAWAAEAEAVTARLLSPWGERGAPLASEAGGDTNASPLNMEWLGTVHARQTRRQLTTQLLHRLPDVIELLGEP